MAHEYGNNNLTHGAVGSTVSSDGQVTLGRPKPQKEFQRLSDTNELIHKMSDKLSNKIKNLPEEGKYKYSGIGHGPTLGIKPIYVYSRDEYKVAEGKGTNSFIVMGRDKPSGDGSGYGSLPIYQCASIDLVVGRYGRYAKHVNNHGPNGEPILTENDFVADAARIYICEKTDIDENFGLVPGRIGNPRGRSAIGIKADNVRIMAREGIKLVTRPDERNSKDGKVDIVVGVDIIAGDNDSDLQPMVKGKNLVTLLKYMIDDSRRLAQMIHSLSLSQATLESMLAAHVHVDPLSGVTLPSVEMGVYCVGSQIRRMVQDIPSQIVQTFNNIAEELEFLEPFGPRYINSKSNNVN
jgi:hypothetical protein